MKESRFKTIDDYEENKRQEIKNRDNATKFLAQ